MGLRLSTVKETRRTGLTGTSQPAATEVSVLGPRWSRPVTRPGTPGGGGAGAATAASPSGRPWGSGQGRVVLGPGCPSLTTSLPQGDRGDPAWGGFSSSSYLRLHEIPPGLTDKEEREGSESPQDSPPSGAPRTHPTRGTQDSPLQGLQDSPSRGPQDSPLQGLPDSPTPGGPQNSPPPGGPRTHPLQSLQEPPSTREPPLAQRRARGAPVGRAGREAPGPTFALLVDAVPVVDPPAVLHQDPQRREPLWAARGALRKPQPPLGVSRGRPSSP